MDYKKYISEKLNIEGVDKQELSEMIAVPPTSDMGDYALPCFKLARALRKSPVMIAEDLKNAFAVDEVISGVSAVNGYLNFKINRVGYLKDVLNSVLSQGEKYGASDEGAGKTVCLDYSSINIAKPFHMGHLSTTAIGAALYRTYKFLGYNAVGINHLGDWGTQFGKLISAFKRWGDKDKVEEGRVREMMKLYVKFHEEAEKSPELEEEGRAYFKKIEDGDEECLKLFNWFKELTLKDVQKIYSLLSVEFDSYNGESFYNDKMQGVINELNEKGLLKDSEGAKIVDLSAYDMAPCLILKADGASLYATRDLAAAEYRKKTYDFYKCLYVVAYQQNLHFKQIFKVLELMGKDYYKDMVHVSYGMVSLEDGSMSTRKGKVIFLEDVINKCIAKVKEIIEEKNPTLESKEETATAVGVGAVIFSTLYNSKIKDIVFSYDKVLSFEGETGPYVQYTAVRCQSVLEKAGEIKSYKVEEVNGDEFEIVKILGNFNSVLSSSLEKYEPSYIARYAMDLAKAYNKFYFDCKILDSEENVKNLRLDITKSTLTVLKTALGLLGIKVPKKM